jgi:hypothetical protein
MAGAILVIVSFVLDAPALLAGAVPVSYAWPIFALGLGLGVLAALDARRIGRPADAA